MTTATIHNGGSAPGVLQYRADASAAAVTLAAARFRAGAWLSARDLSALIVLSGRELQRRQADGRFPRPDRRDNARCIRWSPAIVAPCLPAPLAQVGGEARP